MTTIKAVVRNGRIETDEPIDLPEGTRLDIPMPAPADHEDGWDNSPEAIARWLTWADSLEPLIRTEKEEAEAEGWLKTCDRHEAAKQNRDIDELFQ